MSSEHSLWQEIQQGESKTLEFKQQLPKGEQLAKTLIAFANTSGGKLILGVNDLRQVVGVKEDEFDLMDQIASMAHDHCHPTLMPNIHLETVQGKTLVIVQVYRGSQLPYYLKSKGREKGTYVRLSATNRPASLEMIHELERQRLHQSFDEQAAWDIPLANLELAPLRSAFERIGKPFDNARMRSLKLIKTEQGQDYPTHGLLILLGQYEQAEIKCSRFKGTDMAVFLDKKEYTGNLFSQLAQTEAFIKNHLHLKAEIFGLQRTETYEIPITAIREALVNAFVHRDYSNTGRDIKVGIYDDMVNIVSPGGLPNGLTLDEALKGRSEIRNKVIARVFKELGYIEQWGSGITRLRKLCQQAGNPEPTIKETGDFVDIEFHRTVSTDDAEGSEKSSEKSSEKTPSLLALIQRDPKISARSLAEELGITSRAVEKQIAQLKQQGKLDRIGPAKGGYWKVKG
ncbi:helix-turn-helix domain-containing protein [Lacimicrobium alkaliphilum]|uniref:ATP-dependent DNA helicase n=1 Tax=Lacimicrobium alkaliphilum TaxID=1526571 RepID=A0A0U2ZF94_9ALTE|nr:helix-turn-helix domain-containing protein [Lacimicrobium alkaliphilum]ALS97100.1 ATP-dependent DNA helicase [Lacimicrobium alkaliphilum]